VRLNIVYGVCKTSNDLAWYIAVVFYFKEKSTKTYCCLMHYYRNLNIMFDQILDMVKDHLGNNPQVSSAIPGGQADAIHHEVASSVEGGIKNQVANEGGIGGLLSSLAGAGSSSPVASAITGGLVGTLTSKFGLPPAATGAIAAAIPGILQKFAHKTNDPNDNSLTPDSILGSLGGNSGGGLGGALGGLF
jgi:hypothetical protein